MNSLPWGSIVLNDKSKVCMSAAAAGIISVGACLAPSGGDGENSDDELIISFWLLGEKNE